MFQRGTAVSLLLLSGRRGISAGEKLSLDVTDPLAATHHYLLKLPALIILLKRWTLKVISKMHRILLKLWKLFITLLPALKYINLGPKYLTWSRHPSMVSLDSTEKVNNSKNDWTIQWTIENKLESSEHGGRCDRHKSHLNCFQWKIWASSGVSHNKNIRPSTRLLGGLNHDVAFRQKLIFKMASKFNFCNKRAQLK